MAFQWGGRTWGSDDLDEFVSYLNARGVSYDDWAANHPTAAATFYNPQAYVPGGSSQQVSQAIQDQGYQSMGNTPLDQIPDISTTDTSSDPVTPEGANPVPAPPPGSDVGETGAGYDPAKAFSAAGQQTTGETLTGGPVPSYPSGGTPLVTTTPSGNPASPSTATTNVLGQIGDIDWSSLLGIYGMDANVVAEINRIFTITGGNLQQAIPIAQAYIRGTDWYRRNYPSIQEGINAGLFEDERGYRTYQNQVMQIYEQYYGRPATRAEAASYMSSGRSIQQVAATFQAQALAGTISDPLRQLFTPDEIQAYINEQAGIDTALGQEITQQAEMAMKVQQLYQEFYGRNVTRAELNQLVSGGVTPEQVARNFATTANINGMNPAIRDLFSQNEIRDIALNAAGGISANGQLLAQKAALAAQLNTAYHTFTGQGVTRQEVEDAWAQGLTAEEVGNRLEAGQLQGALPQFLRDIFDENTLRQAAGATAGSDLSAGAVRAQQIVQGAGAYQQVVRQYENRNVTADELNRFYDQEITADRLARQYQGQGIVAAKGEDYQRVLGSFGGGQLSSEELGVLGQQGAGIDTILGQQLQERLNKAQKRLAGAFNSTVSKPALSFVGGRLTTSRGRTPDIGA